MDNADIPFSEKYKFNDFLGNNLDISELKVQKVLRIQAVLRTFLAKNKCDEIKYGSYKFKSFTEGADVSGVSLISYPTCTV